jgi:hypothetical protein
MKTRGQPFRRGNDPAVCEAHTRSAKGERVRSARYPIAAAVGSAFLALVSGSAQAHDPGWTVKGFGTPTIDGVQAAGEWEPAAKRDFAANRLPDEGGGTMPATLYVMNDATNLYLAVKVEKPSLGNTSVAFEFDNDHADHSAGFTVGDDVLLINPILAPSFLDEVRTYAPPCPFVPPGPLCGFIDTEVGGTSEGSGAAKNAGGFSVYEFAHPLNSTDDAHDFSLGVGNRVGFEMSLRFCSTTTCVDTYLPPGGDGDIVVTSLNSVPPETSITTGPADAWSSSEATFVFSGTDDVISPSDLSFECRVDTAAFSTCRSPLRLRNLLEGAHSFAVRALDEADNADPSPASMTWTVDRTPPDTSIAGGPAEGSSTSNRSAEFAPAGQDNLTSARELTFECSLDAAAPIPCATPTVYAGLAEGTHQLAVRAVDKALNIDQTAAARSWIVDRTGPSKPRVRGPRRTSRVRAAYVFSASDQVTSTTRLRFRCGFDRAPLRPCKRRHRQRLRLGRHLLRVVAIDAAGNRSSLARVRVVRTEARRPS